MGYKKFTTVVRVLGTLGALTACSETAGFKVSLQGGGTGNGGSSSQNPIPTYTGNPGSGGGGGAGGTGDPLAIPLTFKVINTNSRARTETVRVTIPFPESAYSVADLNNLIVGGRQTAWLLLARWRDGSVKAAQAQFTDAFAPFEEKNYGISRNVPALTGPFTRNAWVALMVEAFAAGAEVRDTFNVAYRALATGAGEVVQSTPLVRVSRHRIYHTAAPGTGIGRDYLASNLYITEFRDQPMIVVDWILANDYLGADNIPSGNSDPNLRPLGPVDVRSASFLIQGASQTRAYRASYEAISAPEQNGSLQSFRVMTNDWLGDAQTRRYRFISRFQPGTPTSSEAALWQNTFDAMVENPLYAIANFVTWSQTKAAGLLGGPISGIATARQFAQDELAAYNSASFFGTWGSHGDTMATATTGTPRNQQISPAFAHAIQGDYPPLLQKVEQMAWIQTARPHYLSGLVVGDDQQIQLNGVPHWISQEQLGRRNVTGTSDLYPAYRTLTQAGGEPHGWNAFDEEHIDMTLLYDWWLVSGDAWALDAIRVFGQQAKGLMRRFGYYGTPQSARGEGWWMQVMVQVYLATRDENIRSYATHRALSIVDLHRKKNHPSRAIKWQGNYGGTQYPSNHEFFMPWQHAAIVNGYLGAYRAWGDSIFLTIAEDVARTVHYSWMTNVQLPQFPQYGVIPNALRYYVPATHNGTEIPANFFDPGQPGAPLTTSGAGVVHVGDGPLGGAHIFLIAPLFHLVQASSNTEVQSLAYYYAVILRGPVSSLNRADKWFYNIPDTFAAP